MTLSDKIGKLVGDAVFDGKFYYIKNWAWSIHGHNNVEIPASIKHAQSGTSLNLVAFLKIDTLIDEASIEECHATKSQYVIWCKNWMQQRNFKQIWAAAYNNSIDDNVRSGH